KQKSKIAFSAGKDISGNVIACDLAKMPHMLVAGTTGSGKSVFLNSIILCILYRATPREVGLIIVDPKKVEFGVYQGIPHLMKPVVTDPGQAVSTLRWAVGEMTNRYQRMQMSGVRDFKTYNEKFDAGTLSKEEENPKKMQQIVIVIDELADLMMVAAKEVESLICRLAQLARAAGIHLIIATQRPSVDVVTGLIKANIPARVALLVASGVDSRTIIDMVGAEKLLGYGDMLFYPTGYVKPVRVQGAFVSDEEIQKTVKFLTRQSHINYYEKEQAEMDKFNQPESSGQSGSDESDDGSGKYDEYLYEAGKLCIESGKASSSMLQRRFSVGFNRAARIIDQLYEIGAIGPQNGAKPREILVDSIRFEELCQEIGII
ncbi:MAG: DNA translocase FtsK, partial [Lachnospiraceae bacterium]|nr:DNA translocase FtsK [Lachnospiraceae bacterium]